MLRSFKSVCEVMILIKNNINLFYLNLFFYLYIILHFRLSFNHHLPIAATTSYFYFICILFYFIAVFAALILDCNMLTLSNPKEFVFSWDQIEDLLFNRWVCTPLSYWVTSISTEIKIKIQVQVLANQNYILPWANSLKIEPNYKLEADFIKGI